jgi:hypothetical protein
MKPFTIFKRIILLIEVLMRVVAIMSPKNCLIAFICFGISMPSSLDAMSSISSMPFECRVNGAQMLGKSISPNDICGKFSGVLSKKLGKQMQKVEKASGTAWVAVNVRFAKSGIAAATLAYSKNGKVKYHPEISVATSDRAIDGNTVDMLAHAVADQIK